MVVSRQLALLINNQSCVKLKRMEVDNSATISSSRARNEGKNHVNKSTVFEIREHIIPCTYIREYPRGTATEQEDILQLAIKQYIPLENPNPSSGDITIVATHGSGLPKELYEPMFDDLLSQTRNLNFKIRSIWIADAAHHGASGVLNETKLGNDRRFSPHCYDSGN